MLSIIRTIVKRSSFFKIAFLQTYKVQFQHSIFFLQLLWLSILKFTFIQQLKRLLQNKTNKIKQSLQVMQKIKGEQPPSDLSCSNLSKSKKICLIKIFKKSKLQQSDSNPQINHKNSTQTHFPLKQTDNNQIQRQQNPHIQEVHKRRFSQLRAKTQANQKQKNKINIFQSSYIECLKDGYVNPYKQKSKIQNPQKKSSTKFQGPIYFSQRLISDQQSPQKDQRCFQIQEEIYKSDRNPKLMKFKVSLKRNNFNMTEQSKEQSNKNQLSIQKQSRLLITQQKTLKSNSITLISNSQVVNRFIPHKRSYSLLQSGGFENKDSIQKYKKKSFHVPKLSQNSNLFKSIKIYERKRSLIGQIQSQKGLQQKYGKRILQFILRDRHIQAQNKNDFNVKLKTENNEFETNRELKNRFITDIQEGKYNKGFGFKDKIASMKVKGKSKFNIA